MLTDKKRRLEAARLIPNILRNGHIILSLHILSFNWNLAK